MVKRDLPDVVAAMMEEAQQQAEAAAEGGSSRRRSSPEKRLQWPDSFDIDWMNERFSFVLIGGTGVIVMEAPDAPPRDRVRIIKEGGFKGYLGNRFITKKGPDGKDRAVSWGEHYWTHKQRRTYDGITFWPDRDAADGPPGFLNLWRGFDVTARAGGSYAIFRDHLLTNVAHGDQHTFRWIFGWFAQMMQQPREKPGTALVLRGAMGSGKTKVGEVIGSLIPAHYFLVDDPRYVTGNFNSHMSSCLFLQAEEAVWAGDKAAEGRLKSLVTSDFQMIEAKGVDPIRLPNYIRLLMTSNEDWVVPAGKDERRFAVFDVDPRCALNHQYFAEMDEELAAGGREALLADLLAFDLSSVNLRIIPKTGALLEQKVRSLDPIETWLLDRLRAGTPTRKHDAWPEFIAGDAWFDDYADASERIGVKRKAAQTSFGMKLHKLLPGLRPGRPTLPVDGGAMVQRVRGYYLPDLEACREAFAGQMGQSLDWGESDE